MQGMPRKRLAAHSARLWKSSHSIVSSPGGFEHNTAIERPLPEFANSEITHNVEYSLHPATPLATVSFSRGSLPLTARKVVKASNLVALAVADRPSRSSTLLTRSLILRNACTICDLGDRFLNGYLGDLSGKEGQLTVMSLRRRPFAIVECKRIGVEEGTKKGPQTIEKAKQGAYVAKSVSSLQKIRFADGKMGGLIQRPDGSFRCEDYFSLLDEIIASEGADLLSQFVLTVGVVSNHDNWFTSQYHNKELKVLAQSYDWLLFLTDAGIAQFIGEVLLRPIEELVPARDSFLASYTGKKGGNRFTKVKIAQAADAALQSYFVSKIKAIEGWFNVIAPAGKQLATLRGESGILKNKKWEDIHP
jgi:hypothetical protein